MLHTGIKTSKPLLLISRNRAIDNGSEKGKGPDKEGTPLLGPRLLVPAPAGPAWPALAPQVSLGLQLHHRRVLGQGAGCFGCCHRTILKELNKREGSAVRFLLQMEGRSKLKFTHPLSPHKLLSSGGAVALLVSLLEAFPTSKALLSHVSLLVTTPHPQLLPAGSLGWG